MDRNQWIRERAYFLWEKEGKAEGMCDVYWKAASKQWDEEVGFWINKTVIRFLVFNKENNK